MVGRTVFLVVQVFIVQDGDFRILGYRGFLPLEFVARLSSDIDI